MDEINHETKKKSTKFGRCFRSCAFLSCAIISIVVLLLIILVIIYLPIESPTSVDTNLYKIIATKNGRVRGKRFETLFKGMPYFAFRGIPYGKAPIGDRRFKAPEPSEPWSPQILDAIEPGNPCIQNPNYQFVNRTASEDCLNLNVYIPDVNETEQLPVLFIIEGVHFTGGDAEIVEPSSFLEEKLIVITLNYRLSVFGFLSLNTKEYSGNMGVKDLVLAMKWIHQNIEHFNGDKARITLFACSSGATEAFPLLFNAESRQYFQRLILSSGLFGEKYVNRNHRCMIEALARNQSISLSNDMEMVKFLKQVPVDLLFEYTDRAAMATLPLNKGFVWAPIIEVKDAIQPIITDDPYILMNGFDYGNKSLYFTQSDNEVLRIVDIVLEVFGNGKPDMSIPLVDLVSVFKWRFRPDLFDKYGTSYKLNTTNEWDDLNGLTKMLDDHIFVYPTEQIITALLRNTSSIYYSRFRVVPIEDPNVLKSDLNKWMRMAAIHGRDVCYLFEQKTKFCVKYFNEVFSNTTDHVRALVMQTSAHMTTLVSNFVKFGTPTVDNDPVGGFEPVRNGEFNYLDIKNEGLIIGKSPNGRMTELYNYMRLKNQHILNNHPNVAENDVIKQICSLL